MAGFLKWLGFDREKIFEGGVSIRIRVQKLVYFGKVLGLPLNYDFNLYVYGPYSSALSDGYFGMGEREWLEGSIEIRESISRVLNQLRERDELFLEIAATLHSMKTSNPDASEEAVIEAVSDLKSERLREKNVTPDSVRETFGVLKWINLV